MILPLATLSTPVPDVDNYQLRKLLDTNILVSWITACLCFIVTVNHNQEPYVYFYYYPPPPVCILPMATTLTQLAPLPHWKPEKKGSSVSSVHFVKFYTPSPPKSKGRVTSIFASGLHFGLSRAI